MDEKSFHSLYQGINEDLPLTKVTSTDSTCSCCPITTKASDYDPNLSQPSFQPQAFNISQLPRSALQPLVQSRPSTTPRPYTGSIYSYFPITQHGDFAAQALEYDPILFQASFQPQAFNSPQLALSTIQPQAQSWPFTDNPTTSTDNINYSLSPSDRIPSPTRRPSISTPIHSNVTTSSKPASPTRTPSISTPIHSNVTTGSKPASPNKAHSDSLSSHSENRKSRRRAQNCAAQRSFRARKEEMIKDSFVRLEIVKAKLERLERDNGNLSNTVDSLRGEINGWRREHGVLKRSSVEEVSF